MFNRSFYDFCMEIKNEDILNLWDNDKNDKSPDEVSCYANYKAYFKCPRGLHESRQIIVQSVVHAFEDGREYTICKKCNSIGQFIIDIYGEDYLKSIWSDKNEKSYFDISSGGATKFWIRCLDDETHPDYDICGYNFKVSHKCPYCLGKKVCLTNSLGYKHPEVIPLWSDKNELTPFDFTSNSSVYAWFKCKENLHDEYRRKIDDATNLNYVCPVCGINNKHILRGEEHPNWQGGLKTEAETIRESRAYARWRKIILEKDNYTCQCCGRQGGQMNIHHIYCFSKYKDLRMDENNGITMCVSCHSNRYEGALHQIYGTNNEVTPQQLEQYINERRKQLGIPIPFSIDDYKKGNIMKPDLLQQIKDFYKVWRFVPYTALHLYTKPNNYATNPTDHINIKPKFKI